MKSRQQLIDEVIVLRAMQGPEGLDALAARWHEPFLRHARRILGGREEDARDVVQEAWCAIVRSLDRLEEPGAFAGWAFRIITNKCHDWGRKQGRQAGMIDRYGQTASRVEPPLRETDYPALDEALASLDPDTRLLVALYYEEGLSIREVAAFFKLPENTIKTRLHRARKELRAHMEGHTNGR